MKEKRNYDRTNDRRLNLLTRIRSIADTNIRETLDHRRIVTPFSDERTSTQIRNQRLAVHHRKTSFRTRISETLERDKGMQRREAASQRYPTQSKRRVVRAFFDDMPISGHV